MSGDGLINLVAALIDVPMHTKGETSKKQANVLTNGKI